MRTRRSWRNQERLWRALGGQPEAAPKTNPIESLQTAISSPFCNKRTRSMLERDLKRELAKARNQ